MNQRLALKMSDVQRSWDSTKMTFVQPNKFVRRLQKMIGGLYQSDTAFCDFCGRALQNEQFWVYVCDYTKFHSHFHF